MDRVNPEREESGALDQMSDALIAVGVPVLTGIPAPLATAAWRAISYLIAGTVGIPGAWLHQQANRIADTTAARSKMTRALAEAATRQAVADPAIVDRTMWRLLGEETRKQLNREAVARAAAVELQKFQGGDATPNGGDPDPDWLNALCRYADDASSEVARQRWGKVLASELQKPGRISRVTMRFLSEIDVETAQLFEEIAPLIVSESIPDDEAAQSFPLFGKLLVLQEAGLLVGVGATMNRTFETNSAGELTVIEPGGMLCLKFQTVGEKMFPANPLTKMGNEIREISRIPTSLEALRALARYFDRPRYGVNDLVAAELYPGAPVGESSAPTEILKAPQTNESGGLSN